MKLSWYCVLLILLNVLPLDSIIWKTLNKISRGSYLGFNCPKQSVINVRNFTMYMQGSDDEDVKQKCANQIYRNLINRCDNKETCRVLVQDSLCHSAPVPEIISIENVRYTCKDKCSWLNRWCWPGSCSSGLATNCSCMSGFHETETARCQLNLSNIPEIDSCLTRAISLHGKQAMSLSGTSITSKCSLQNDFYGKFQVDRMQIDLTSHFKVAIPDYKYRRPKFVPEELFGVVGVYLEIHKVNVTGHRIDIGKQVLKAESSEPITDYAANNVTTRLRQELYNGESLCLSIHVSAGGYLVSENIENQQRQRISYEKTHNSKKLCFIHDAKPPSFCRVKGSCAEEPLHLASRLTKSRYLEISFPDWYDPYPEHGTKFLASGIDSYELSIYEVTDNTPDILMRDNSLKAGPYKATKDQRSINIVLPEKNPMLYAILLEVKDKADNVRHARRFVLYDNSSVITINDRIPFRVDSASNNTKWQINHGSICYSWKNRFLKTEYVNNNPLRPIKTDSYKLIQGIYDQTYGILPVNGTTNINGLTEFFYSLLRNKHNVLSGKVENFTSQSLCLITPMQDGDTFEFHLQSRDIMKNILNDSVQVHIDRSVPEISDIWLVRKAHKQLYVHNSADLSSMYLEFKAIDVHSGIREIKWSFGTNENKTVLIQKALGVKETNKSDSCVNTTSCYCPIVGACASTTFVAELKKLKSLNRHNGNHNRRYFFTVTATNNAFLVAYDHIDILVDESPPEVGVVLEGPVGSSDIDYTSINEFTVHWHGFIDHESGIKFYRVAIGRGCIKNLKDMTTGNINGSFVQETPHVSTKMVFPDGYGKYHVTVIAFNNAMSPSKIACSDGITYDESVPEIVNVSIKHAQTVESIGCYDGIPWLMKQNLLRVNLSGDECSKVCRNKSNDDIFTLLPITLETINEDNAVSKFMCRSLSHYKQNFIYTPTDLFHITLNISEDHSQIAHAYVGFGRDKSLIDSPDLMDYTKTHHLTSYIQHHPGLIGEEQIFVFIKVQNRAGLDTKIWFGPILADETPPVCQDIPKPVIDNGYVIARWDIRDFYDTEQTEEIGSVMFRMGKSVMYEILDNIQAVEMIPVMLHNRRLEKNNVCFESNKRI